jgi:hypothetical protein
MNAFRKTLTAAVAAIAVASAGLATVTEAEAGPRRHYHKGSSAAPVIAGLIGGLAIGALAASAARSHARERSYAYDPGYGYAPAPVYGGGYVHAPAYSDGYAYSGYRRAFNSSRDGLWDSDGRPCPVQKQHVYDQWGNYAGKQKVRVCR